MQIMHTPLPGVQQITIPLFRDERGFFCERYHAGKFVDHSLTNQFVQDNHSRSAPGVIRGLHYQRHPDQAKLVSCLKGRIWDVAVDIRPDSSYFGQHFGIELSGDSGDMLFIPAGFAHGFCVLGEEEADVVYKVDGLYNPAGEGGIRFDDPSLNIPWPVSNAKVSARDMALPDWQEYCRQPAF